LEPWNLANNPFLRLRARCSAEQPREEEDEGFQSEGDEEEA